MINLVPRYRVQLIEKDGQHFYSINEDPKWLRGVTGILSYIAKPALVPWAAKCVAEYTQAILSKRCVRETRFVTRKKGISIAFPDDRFLELLFKRSKKQPQFKKETAARVGTHAHNVFDALVKTPEIAHKPTPFLPSFQYWLKKEKLHIVGGDTKIASIKHGYGGSWDVPLADEQGRLVIGDYKTGKYLYDSHAYQVAAYGQAAVETFGLDYFPEGVVIRLVNGKEQYERRKVRDMKHSFAGFKAAMDLADNDELPQYSERILDTASKLKQEKTNGKVVTAVR